MTTPAEIARTCLIGSETNALSFPQIVATLIEGGFEGYAMDFRRRSATYYLGSGETLVLPLEVETAAIAAAFDAATVREAIGEAQRQAPGYSYAGFCEKVTGAGCAGYMVSFSGRRVVYYGRTAECHVEHFPQ